VAGGAFVSAAVQHRVLVAAGIPTQAALWLASAKASGRSTLKFEGDRAFCGPQKIRAGHPQWRGDARPRRCPASGNQMARRMFWKAASSSSSAQNSEQYILPDDERHAVSFCLKDCPQ